MRCLQYQKVLQSEMVLDVVSEPTVGVVDVSAHAAQEGQGIETEEVDKKWWVVAESNSRSPPCKDGVITTRLTTLLFCNGYFNTSLLRVCHRHCNISLFPCFATEIDCFSE